MHRSDATPSQLDILAEINVRAARQHRSRQWVWIAVAGGGALLSAALWWWSMQGRAARAPAPPPPAAAVPVEAQRDQSAPVAQAEPAASVATVMTLPDLAAAPARGALPASAPREAVQPVGTAAADERARKARDALQVRQERSRAEARERA